jgi:tetratricopeptide (TPR) repeat protein
MSRRETLMKELQLRIQTSHTKRDWSLMLAPEALAAMDELSGAQEADGPDFAGLRVLGWAHWVRFLALSAQPDSVRRAEFEAALTLLGPCFAAARGPFPASLTPVLADRAAVASVHAVRRAQADPTDTAAFDEAILLAGRSAQATAPDHPRYSGRLRFWANTLHLKYRYAPSAAGLDEMIAADRRVLETAGPQDPQTAEHISTLASSLHERWNRSAAPADLHEAVRLAHLAAATAAPDLPMRTEILTNICRTLLVRFTSTADMADLEAAERMGRATLSVAAPEHPPTPTVLMHLGLILHERSTRTGESGALNEAVTVSRQAVRISAAVPGSADAAPALAQLGKMLLARYELAEALEDLDEAIGALRSSASGSVGSAKIDNWLAILASALMKRHERTSDPSDLNEAITTGRDAIRHSAPDNTTTLPTRMANLSTALHRRYLAAGEGEDLDAAIAAGRQARRLVAQDAADRAAILSFLGSCLSDRFLRYGSRDDLDEAVSLGREAVAAASGNALIAPLVNLIAALYNRYQDRGLISDLEDAIKIAERAVQTAGPNHPHSASILSNQSVMFHALYERNGSAHDLEQAIRTARRAVESTPDGHPNRTRIRNSLAIALLARAKSTEADTDLDEAIGAIRLTLAASTPEQQIHAALVSNLGSALHSRFRARRNEEDRQTAIDLYEQVAHTETASPALRIRTAQAAARLCRSADPTRAANLVETAVHLLPALTAHRLNRADKQQVMLTIPKLTHDAGVFALEDTAMPPAQRAVRALALLEASRSVLFGQALDLRADVSLLRRDYPDLAQSYAALATALNREPDPNALDGASFGAPGGGPAVDRPRTAWSLAQTVNRIRSIEGFETFARSLTASEMFGEAHGGPIVTLNLSRDYTDALLLTRTGVDVLRLPGATAAEYIAQVRVFLTALRDASDPEPGKRIAAQAALRSVLEWLWDALTGPVLHQLGIVDADPDGDWPRVWWSPGGAFGMLPLHAAGYHTDPPGQRRRTVFDRAISSYTPTVRALRYARRQSAPDRHADQVRSLVVAMPFTPNTADYGPLPGVQDEADSLCLLLPEPLLLMEPNPSAPEGPGTPLPTRAKVLEEMEKRAIIHFACHGDNDMNDPSNSMLYLHDHAAAPLNAASLAPANLEHAQIAFLSACNTARNLSVELFDESIHLAGAFQLAGFRHVIGTLWTADDQIAASIAAGFYSALQSTSSAALDPARSAAALHHTTRQHRDALPNTPTLWATHMHFGA